MKEIEDIMLCGECDTNDTVSDADWNHFMSTMSKTGPKGASGVGGIMEPPDSKSVGTTTYTKLAGNVNTPEKRISVDLDPSSKHICLHIRRVFPEYCSNPYRYRFEWQFRCQRPHLC